MSSEFVIESLDNLGLSDRSMETGVAYTTRLHRARQSGKGRSIQRYDQLRLGVGAAAKCLAAVCSLASSSRRINGQATTSVDGQGDRRSVPLLGSYYRVSALLLAKDGRQARASVARQACAIFYLAALKQSCTDFSVRGPLWS